VIVTLGRYSMAHFLPNARISDVHGQAAMSRGRLIVAMYHPAAALHQGSLRPVLERDFARLPELVARASTAAAAVLPANAQDGKPAGDRGQGIGEEEAENKPQPKQLSLF
jgi:uracil-DNA glycosylase